MNRPIFVAALAALVFLSASAAEAFLISLTNRSGRVLTEAVLTPTETKRPVTVFLNLADTESREFTRPEGDLLDLVFKHDGGSYSFREASFFDEENVNLTLVVDQAGVPALEYYEQGEVAAAPRGENSDWNFSKILDSFPWGLGVTTRARAEAQGAKPTAEAAMLTTTYQFMGDDFSVKMTFDGHTAESLLTRLEMSAPDNEEYDYLDFVGDELTANGYQALLAGSGKKTLNLAALAAKGIGEDERTEQYYTLLGERADPTLVVFVPQAAFDRLAQAPPAGPEGRPDLAPFGDQAVFSYHTQGGRVTMVLSQAKDFRAAE